MLDVANRVTYELSCICHVSYKKYASMSEQRPNVAEKRYKFSIC